MDLDHEASPKSATQGCVPYQGLWFSFLCVKSDSNKEVAYSTMDASRDNNSRGVNSLPSGLPQVPSFSNSAFHDAFLANLSLDVAEPQHIVEEIKDMGRFPPNRDGNMADQGVNRNTDSSIDIDRLIMDISKSDVPNVSNEDLGMLFPDEVADVSLPEPTFTENDTPNFCNQNTPFFSLFTSKADPLVPEALESVQSTHFSSPSIQTLSKNEPNTVEMSKPFGRQDSMLESLPSNASSLSERLSPFDTSDSSSQSFCDHSQYVSVSSSTDSVLKLPPPGRPGRKPSSTGRPTYKRRVVEKNTEEYIVKRAKNNIAIRKCREKAKRKQEEMEGKMQFLENENKQLKEKVKELTKELQDLKTKK